MFTYIPLKTSKDKLDTIWKPDWTCLSPFPYLPNPYEECKSQKGRWEQNGVKRRHQNNLLSHYVKGRKRASNIHSSFIRPIQKFECVYMYNPPSHHCIQVQNEHTLSRSATKWPKAVSTIIALIMVKTNWWLTTVHQVPSQVLHVCQKRWLANDLTSRYSPKYADHYKCDDISKNTLPGIKYPS